MPVAQWKGACGPIDGHARADAQTVLQGAGMGAMDGAQWTGRNGRGTMDATKWIWMWAGSNAIVQFEFLHNYEIQLKIL